MRVCGLGLRVKIKSFLRNYDRFKSNFFLIKIVIEVLLLNSRVIIFFFEIALDYTRVS
jgi:hypothetical protein